MVVQLIAIYMHHKNITYENFKTEIVLLWHLLLEEYGPTKIYI